MIKQQLGERLKQYRMSQGYSQERFAAAFGFDRTYIAGIESGKRNITIDNAKKIADALTISLADLFDFTKSTHQSFIIIVNGENFILEASKEITQKEKDEIETIASLAFDEEESSLLDVSDCKSVNELCELPVYAIAELLIKKIEQVLEMKVSFKPIELEVKIDY